MPDPKRKRRRQLALREAKLIAAMTQVVMEVRRALRKRGKHA